jgi:hypothetical protein
MSAYLRVYFVVMNIYVNDSDHFVPALLLRWVVIYIYIYLYIVIKTLYYKPEGRGFETRWVDIFKFTYTFWPH